MLHFKPVSYDEVRKAILSILQDCSTGHDNIPAKYLKNSTEYITSPICHIVKRCIELNHFPDQWKVSRISPIPKIKNPQVPSDYRPISILPIMSKVCHILNHIRFSPSTSLGLGKDIVQSLSALQLHNYSKGKLSSLHMETKLGITAARKRPTLTLLVSWWRRMMNWWIAIQL